MVWVRVQRMVYFGADHLRSSRTECRTLLYNAQLALRSQEAEKLGGNFCSLVCLQWLPRPAK